MTLLHIILLMALLGVGLLAIAATLVAGLPSALTTIGVALLIGAQLLRRGLGNG